MPSIRPGFVRYLCACLLVTLLLTIAIGTSNWLDRQPDSILRMPGSIPVRGIVFSPDGRLLALLQNPSSHVLNGIPSFDLFDQPQKSDPCPIQLYDVGSGRRQCEWVPIGEHPLSIQFSPDGSCLSMLSVGGEISVWDTQTGKKQLSIPAAASDGAYRTIECKFVPFGRSLICIRSNGESSHQIVELWDPKGNGLLASMPCGPGGPAFSSDDRTMATWQRHVHPIAPRVVLHIWKVRAGQPPLLLRDRNLPAWAKVPSPDLKAFFGVESHLRLWNVDAGREQAEASQPNDGCGDASFSPDGRILFVPLIGSSMPRVYRIHENVLDLVGKIPSRHLLSGNGRLLVVDNGRALQLLDSLSLAERMACSNSQDRSLPPNGQNDGDFAEFSPDSKLLATSVVNQPSVNPVVAWIGRYLPVLGLAPRPRPTVHLWDIENNREIAEYPGQLLPVFSPDGSTLATTSAGAVYLWRVPPRQHLWLAISIACVGTFLTLAAWRALKSA